MVISKGDKVAVFNRDLNKKEIFLYGIAICISKKIKNGIYRPKFKLPDGSILGIRDCWFLHENHFKELYIKDKYKEGWVIIDTKYKSSKKVTEETAMLELEKLLSEARK